MGSLFKTREIWSMKLDDDEGFHCNSLILANIDNEPNGSEKIIVGSLKGILRVFHVRSNGYTPNDLLVESDLTLPILQVAAGRLLPASSNLNLVILHPRKISIYSVSGTAGLSDQGSNYNILLMYEHVLQRSAFNMTLGSFGRVKGKDFICIQALDGTLSIYEQESYAFSRFLPNYLLPGPFKYDSINDSFIVGTVSRTIESYRYHVLAIAKDDEDSSGKRAHGTVKNVISRGRRVAPDWTCMIGENALDICVLENSNVSIIVVLGEHNLFMMSEKGELTCSRKFDFNPMCMCSYILPNAQVMMLIASEYNSLLIFNYTRIKWIAKMSCSPIAIQRGTINGTPGILTCLSDTGDLTSFYLGTNPSFLLKNITPSFQEFNFEESSQELKSLKRIIKSFTNSAAPQVNAASKSAGKHSTDDVTVDIERSNSNQDEYTGVTNVPLKITLSTGNSKLCNVRVSSTLWQPLTVDKSLVTLDAIDSDSSVDTTVIVSSQKYPPFLPSDLKIVITILYHVTSTNSVCKIKQIDFLLPLSLIASLTSSTGSPLKHNFSIDIINSPKLTLSDLMSSIDLQGVVDATLQLSVDKVNTFVSVSLVPKKMVEVLTLKSDSYESLNLISLHVLQRCIALNCKFDCATVDKNSLSLNSYYNIIDAYSSCNDRLAENESNLERQSSHLKCIIKRILIKLKDRNPSPLNQLDVMLDRVQSKLFTLTDQGIKLQREITAIVNNLHTAGTLIAQLLAIVTSMKSEQGNLLRCIFASDDNYNIKRDWGVRFQLALRDLPSIRSLDNKVDLDEATQVTFVPDKLKCLIETVVDLAYKGDLFERNRIQPSASSEASSSPPPPGPALKSNFIGPTNTVIPEEDEDER